MAAFFTTLDKCCEMMPTKLIAFAFTMMISAVVALPVGGALFRPSLRNAPSAKFSRDARRNEPLSPAGTRTEQTDFGSFVDLLQLGSSQKAHMTLAGKLPSTSSTLPPPPPPSPQLPSPSPSSPPPRALTTDWSGVWTRGDANSNRSGFPFKGIEFQGIWSEIEAADGVFNWSTLDAILTFAADQGLYVLLSVNVGPDSPSWLYSKGVPQVLTGTDGHDKEAGPYPYYLHPLYISRFNRLVEKLGQYTRGLGTVTAV